MVLTLYKMDVSPPVRAVYMAIEALKIPNVNYVELDLFANEHLTEKYLKINPQHTIPHLTDGDFNVWDSHAIITYLANKYGNNSPVYPTDPEKRALIDNKLYFDSAILYPALRFNDEDVFFGTQTSLTPKGIEMIKSAYDFMEQFLKGRDWLVGDEITLADISCVATISSLNEIIAIDTKLYPNLISWIERCEQIEYYKKLNAPGNKEYGRLFRELLARKF